MIYGMDYLLGPHYPDVILHNHPAGFAVGMFATTGGDAYSLLDKLLATGKVPAIRVQEVWHDNHLFSDKDIPAITRLSQHYEQLALKYPDKKIWLSPFCEAQNIHNPDKYLRVVALSAPHCFPIWCPINGVWSGNYPNEIHGGGPALSGAYIRSGDGGIHGHDDIDLDITHEKQKHSNCEIFFEWSCEYSGHYSMNEPHLPIDQRKGWPTAQQINAMTFLANDKMNTNVSKGYCWKSNSENHGPTDTKAEKGCLIAPHKAHNGVAVLKAQNGATIEQLHYFGVYSDGKSSRYYSQNMGVVIAKHALALSGSPLCDVFIDGNKVATINPAFYENHL